MPAPIAIRFAFALFMLAWTSTAGAQAVVLRSATGHPVGERIHPGARIELPEAERILILWNGATRMLCGPSSGTLADLVRRGTCARHALPPGRPRTAASRETGVPPGAIRVPFQRAHAEPACFTDWEGVSFAFSSAAVPTLDGAALAARPHGRRPFIGRWPAGLPQESGREYVLRSGDGAASRVIVHVDPADPVRALQEMIRRGCKADVEKLAGLFPVEGLGWSDVSGTGFK